ncbi:hypothetical protein [Candidatus Frankia nodulisporulans]|uniref:hypothetical protein n=1 Tax=Candidatus Frankia nodulisporulans TaxID=2060052 RepID=UPI0013D41D2F|nr:hypothetical protein [Candidatus Frankia nodulisporulans]
MALSGASGGAAEESLAGGGSAVERSPAWGAMPLSWRVGDSPDSGLLLGDSNAEDGNSTPVGEIFSAGVTGGLSPELELKVFSESVPSVATEVWEAAPSSVRGSGVRGSGTVLARCVSNFDLCSPVSGPVVGYVSVAVAAG